MVIKIQDMADNWVGMVKSGCGPLGHENPKCAVFQQ